MALLVREMSAGVEFSWSHDVFDLVHLRHGNYQQDHTQLGVSTSGRTTPTIILDNSASENQNRFASLKCVKFMNIRSKIYPYLKTVERNINHRANNILCFTVHLYPHF